MLVWCEALDNITFWGKKKLKAWTLLEKNRHCIDPEPVWTKSHQPGYFHMIEIHFRSTIHTHTHTHTPTHFSLFHEIFHHQIYASKFYVQCIPFALNSYSNFKHLCWSTSPVRQTLLAKHFSTRKTRACPRRSTACLWYNTHVYK